ncbi:spore germination protein KA [Anaerovirgula multivorans]|uniref:Spore germination protein KA n=1 Tax=Anaerovirgula multivorans TaxID=312168 RepID=A0A238ZY01_9FIRM|nr:spore germination protein [Anaerovirgula multivorans]SNR87664.1 spore germination protein KA [Anaerovirgula multivorans]
MKKFRRTKKPIRIGSNFNRKEEKKNNRLQSVFEEIEIKSEKSLEKCLLSDKLEDNYESISSIFNNCYGVILRKFTIGEKQVESFIVYIDGMVNRDDINQNVLKSLMTDIKNTDYEKESYQENLLSLVMNSLISVSEVIPVYSIKEAVKFILKGYCVIFIDENNGALAMNTVGGDARKVSEPLVETVLRGPMEAFVEDINVNTTLIRRRIKTPDLKIEKFNLGRLSQTEVVMCYIEGIAAEDVLSEIRQRLSRIDTDVIIEGGEIEFFTEDNWLSPFPLSEVTERPDSSAASLAEGRVVIIADGSPFVLIVPVTFSYFFTAPEDYYNKFFSSSFVRLLRYFAFFITLTLPPLYVAITTYHHEMIPSILLISIANARAEIPFPAVVEAFFMEITFEIIREAGARLPISIGQSLSIVGALVIGNTAIQAGLVSPGMVIVVAITAISSFLIPKINSYRAISVLRFPMLLLASTMGVFGIIAGVLTLLIHLASLRSFGVPFLSPFTPISLEDWKDTFIMLPKWLIHKRPTFLQHNNQVRTERGLAPKPPNKDNE